jgi:hypothetical protein
MRVLITSLLFAAGCVAPNGDESFVIRNNLAPQGDGTCSFTADTGAAVLSRGFIDTASSLPYQLHPLFESRINAPEGRESLRTIQVTGAEVTLEIGPIEIIEVDEFGDVVNVTVDDFFDNSTEFTSLFSTSLGPNQGLSTATVDIVPLSAIALIRNRVGPDVFFNAQTVAVVNPFGEYYGEEIDGTEYRYPVTVCNSCARQIVGDCEQPDPGATMLAFSNGCNPFQDGVIECCRDTVNGGLLCAR